MAVKARQCLSFCVVASSQRSSGRCQIADSAGSVRNSPPEEIFDRVHVVQERKAIATLFRTKQWTVSERKPVRMNRGEPSPTCRSV